MTAVQNFITWFISQIPSFLMSEPIKYFVGFFFLGIVISLFKRIINIT